MTLHLTRASALSVLLLGSVLGCKGEGTPPNTVDTAIAARSVEQLSDSLRDEIAKAFDTTNSSLIWLNTQLLDSLATNATDSAMAEASADVTVEISTLGSMRMALTHEPSAVPNTDIWTFTDSTDASNYGTLVRVDSAYSGRMWKQGVQFELSPAGSDSVFVLRRVVPGNKRPEGNPRRPPQESTSGFGRGARSGATGDRRPAARPGLLPCKPAVIDVLVAVPAGDTLALAGYSKVKADVITAAKLTNRALYASGLAHRIRLVDVVVTSGEGSGLLEKDLNRLSNNSDGWFDEALAQRATKRADVLGLWTRQATDLCGLGYMLTDFALDAPWAHFVVAEDCAIDLLSFAHELGHNLGLEHDWENKGKGEPFVNVAFGFRQPSHRGRDIMAYDCPGGCDRALMFSNLTERWNGEPIGVKPIDAMSRGADAASALNLSACKVEAFR